MILKSSWKTITNITEILWKSIGHIWDLPAWRIFSAIIYIARTLKNYVQLLLSTRACVWGAFHLIRLPEWRILANEMGRQHDRVAIATWSFGRITVFLSVCCFGNFKICSFAALQKFLLTLSKIFWSGWQVILKSRMWWHNHR